MSSYLIISVAAALLFMLLLAGIRRVPEGTALTVSRLGRYARTLEPGLRFVLPGLERASKPVALINHRIQLPLDGGEASAKPAAFYYQIIEPKRSGHQLNDIDSVVEREVRQLLGASLVPAAGDIDALNGRVKQALNAHLGALGLRVTRCQLGA